MDRDRHVPPKDGQAALLLAMTDSSWIPAGVYPPLEGGNDNFKKAVLNKIKIKHPEQR